MYTCEGHVFAKPQQIDVVWYKMMTYSDSKGRI